MATRKAAKTTTTKARRSKPAQPAPAPEVLIGDDTISRHEDEENGRMVEATKAANGTEAASKPVGKRGRKAKSVDDLAPVTTCTGCGAVNPQVGPNERTTCCAAATETIVALEADQDDSRGAAAAPPGGGRKGHFE